MRRGRRRRVERGDEDLFDVSEEAFAVDRTVQESRGAGAVTMQSGQERHGLPAAVRHLGLEPQAAWRPAPQRRHVGLSPGLVDEDQARGIDPAPILRPLRPPAGDVRTILLAGERGFFLKLSFSAWTKFHTVR